MRRSISGWLLMLAALGLLALVQRPGLSTAASAIVITSKVYLPLAMRPMESAIVFSSSADESGRPSPPMTTISPNARQLFYNVTVRGASGRPYRIEYQLPGGPIDPDIGVIPSDPFEALGMICYTSNGDCGQPTGALVPGRYTIRVFIDNQLLNESSATVAASLDAPAIDSAAGRGMRQPSR
jgi:hypothetical protein